MKRIALLTIGDELLNGRTINTNLSDIAKALFQEGFALSWAMNLPDTRDILLAGLKQIKNFADIFILTGGLGPTHDDQTIDVVSEFLGISQIIDQNYLAVLKERYQDRPIAYENQATVLQGAKVLSNVLGTAPGQLIVQDNKIFILLPGVPQEVNQLIKKTIIPWLQKTYVSHKPLRQHLRLYKTSEGAVHERLRQIAKKYPMVTIGVYPNLSLLDFHIIAQEQNAQQWQQVVELLKREFGENIYSDDQQTLVEKICHLLQAKQLHLTLLESFTGGYLTQQISCLEQNNSKQWQGSNILPRLTKDNINDCCQTLDKQDSASWVLLSVSHLEKDCVSIDCCSASKSSINEIIKITSNSVPLQQKVAHLALANLHQYLSTL